MNCDCTPSTPCEIHKPNQAPLNTLQKAANFAEALIKHVQSGLPNVSQEVYDERLKICKSCEFFKQDTSQCLKCGCYINIKGWWAEQECPIKKWLPVVDLPEKAQKPKGCCK